MCKNFISLVAFCLLLISSVIFNSCAPNYKGGTRITIQPNMADIMTEAASYSDDSTFVTAVKSVDPYDKNFIEKFLAEYQKLGGNSLAEIFQSKIYQFQDGTPSLAETKKLLQQFADTLIVQGLENYANRFKEDGYDCQVVNSGTSGLGVIEIAGNYQKDVKHLEQVVNTVGKLGFYETFPYSEIEQQLNAINSKEELDQLLQKPEFPGSCCIGRAAEKDMAKIDAILAANRSAFEPNIKFCWTAKPEKDNAATPIYGLIALKTNNGYPFMNGNYISYAAPNHDALKGYYLNLKMDEKGAILWSRLTGKNVGKQIAMVIDGKVYSYPNVNSQIEGGDTEISGNFTEEETKELATVLSNSSPFALKIIKAEEIK